MPRTVRPLLVCAALTVIRAGCGGAAESDGGSWPEPPAVDQAQYRKGHDAWLEKITRRNTTEEGRGG